MGRSASDKRERLITAAITCFHRHGFARTSIVDIAREAGIAAGNVFYYFKTKDDLVRAVVDAWCRLLGSYLADFDPEPDVWRRIDCFIDQAAIMGELYVTWGCPLAGLARDLRLQGGGLSREAARSYAVQAEWLAGQFGGAGFAPAKAKDHADALMARYHGAILLAHAQHDATVIDQEGARLKRWLNELRHSSEPRVVLQGVTNPG